MMYKIVGIKGEAIHGGTGRWHLPKGARFGKWMPEIENVSACKRGYHLTPERAIVEWLPLAPQKALLCQAEGRGATIADNSKVVFAQARLLKVIGLLDETSMRLAAADMAERVLPIFQKERPSDDRPARAIQAARDFAHDKIDVAAKAAAGAAAGDAAGDAARDAARAAVWAAARDAAGAAAQAAARDAARDATAKIILLCSSRQSSSVGLRFG